ncbi:cytochrome P450 2H2-like [Camelus bactrianus]|uniref:Cytochrome P450 2H2-like n=1 Tax=Camelus bactrianus TaxID=9837 RepID=A0AC58RD59_CAMBA
MLAVVGSLARPSGRCSVPALSCWVPSYFSSLISSKGGAQRATRLGPRACPSWAIYSTWTLRRGTCCFSGIGHVQWPGVEGAKKVCPDDTEELWFRKEELRGTHSGRGPLPHPGSRGGGRTAFRPDFKIKHAVSIIICSIMSGERFDYKDDQFQELLRLLDEFIHLQMSIFRQLQDVFPRIMKFLSGSH